MSVDPIPVFTPAPDVERHWDQLRTAAESVIRSGYYILGPEEKAFEAEAAAYLGVDHAIGVNSGTDALILALRALDIGPGDEVITTAFTFFATSEGIDMLGGTTVFVDIDPVTFNIDPAAVEAAITERTKAILPVHLFGQAADMDALGAVAARHGIPIIEDVAQAFGGVHDGKKLGSIGALGTFSFFPTKNLGGFGDGGLVTTNDDELADTVSMLRKHGSRKKYHNEAFGYNSRLDELQAALLRVKLPHIDDANKGRRVAAERYASMLAPLDGVVAPEAVLDHIFHQYTVRVTDADRDGVQDRMKAAGVNTMIYYPVPLHHLPVYAHIDADLPVTEAACGQVLSLPMWPEIDEATQQRVIDALGAALG